jgi:hypothetical protein
MGIDVYTPISSAIDALVHYDGKRAADIATSRFAVRSMVSQAVCIRLRGLKHTETLTVPWSRSTLKWLSDEVQAQARRTSSSMACSNRKLVGEDLLLAGGTDDTPDCPRAPKADKPVDLADKVCCPEESRKIWLCTDKTAFVVATDRFLW